MIRDRFEMAANGELVCSEVAHKVEIEDKCGSGVNVNGVGVVATVDCNVGGNCNGNGNGNGNVGGLTDVFVSGCVEVSAGEIGSGLEGDQFKKEELGVEEGMVVDPLVSETNGVLNGNVGGTVKDGNDGLTCVLVNSCVEVSADEFGDTESVNVDEVDQFKKEGLGVEKEGMVVNPLASETNGVIHGGVGGTVKDGNGDLTSVLVNGSVEVSADEFGDTESVNVDGEVDQFEKEGLGVEKEGMVVDPLVAQTNGVVHGDTAVSVVELKAVKDDVILENGCTVNPPVVLVTNGIDQDVNGDLKKIFGGQEADVKSEKVVGGAKMNDTGFGLTESTLNTVEGSQVSVFELESAIKLSDVMVTHSLSRPDVINETDESHSGTFTVSNADDGVMVNDGPESVINLVGKAECQVTIDGSGKISEDLEFQVRADGSESSGNSIVEQKGQETFDVSSKPSEDLGAEVTADEPESCGSPIKEHDCEVLVDGSESIGSLVYNQGCPVSANTIVVESDGKSEEHELVIPSEVNVEIDPNHVCSMIKAEIKKAEGTEIRSGIESEENPDSGLVLPEEVDVVANGEVEKFDRILEMNTEEMKEQVKVTDEIQEFQRAVIDNVQHKLSLVDDTAEFANEAEVSLEAEANIEVANHETASSQYGASNCIDKPQEGLQPVASAVETTTTMESECNSCELLVGKDNGPLFNSVDLTTVEQKFEIESHLGTENKSAEGLDCGTGIEKANVSDDDENETEVKYAEGKDCGTRVENVVVSDDEEKEIEIKDAHVELVHNIVPENRYAEDMSCETGIKNVNFPDEGKESEVSHASVGDQSRLSFSDEIVKHGAAIEFGSFGRHEATPSSKNEEVEDMNGIQSDRIPDSSVVGEINDAADVQNEEVEVLEYNFLVRIPRFEDENLRDQIKSAQELVEEKTRIRDSIRVKVLEKRDMLKSYNEEYDRVKKDDIAARRVVKAKRQEIESVQAIISRWKNAMTVQDIDNKIFGVEYMIQHETVRLIDEKEFIREIKKLKTLRDELASNMGTPEEIRHAIDTKDHNEERMKTLKKELESLKREVSKVEAVLEKIVVNYEETSYQERELQRQFRTADNVRQKAYADLNDLKKLSYDKNQNFRQFKEDFMTAKNFLSQGDKDALHRLCSNQVETFMEQWNNNDEFRHEYVSRCNTIASRKQKASDGAPLVPDEVAPVLPSNVDGKVDRSSVSLPGEVKHVSVDASSIEGKNKDNHDIDKSIEKVSGQKNHELKNKGVAKPTDLGNGDVAKEAELAVVAELAENIPTKEEIELARKAEELRKEEIAAKLKEQRRLEEKAKAIEALERKKRNAEKAQLRAELRARKEAEQKEKEREKRLRKKEKKTGDGCINGEEAAASEGSNEVTTKEIETVTNKKKSQKLPAHFFSKQLKPKAAPSPLINKNKKRWQRLKQVAFGILTVLGVVFVFLLANFGLFLELKPAKLNVAF